eukprot:4802054-Alexandrium_andersonii.AAC.1
MSSTATRESTSTTSARSGQLPRTEAPRAACSETTAPGGQCERSNGACAGLAISVGLAAEALGARP